MNLYELSQLSLSQIQEKLLTEKFSKNEKSYFDVHLARLETTINVSLGFNASTYTRLNRILNVDFLQRIPPEIVSATLSEYSISYDKLIELKKIDLNSIPLSLICKQIKLSKTQEELAYILGCDHKELTNYLEFINTVVLKDVPETGLSPYISLKNTDFTNTIAEKLGADYDKAFVYDTSWPSKKSLKRKRVQVETPKLDSTGYLLSSTTSFQEKPRKRARKVELLSMEDLQKFVKQYETIRDLYKNNKKYSKDALAKLIGIIQLGLFIDSKFIFKKPLSINDLLLFTEEDLIKALGEKNYTKKFVTGPIDLRSIPFSYIHHIMTKGDSNYQVTLLLGVSAFDHVLDYLKTIGVDYTALKNTTEEQFRSKLGRYYDLPFIHPISVYEDKFKIEKQIDLCNKEIITGWQQGALEHEVDPESFQKLEQELRSIFTLQSSSLYSVKMFQPVQQIPQAPQPQPGNGKKEMSSPIKNALKSLL